MQSDETDNRLYSPTPSSIMAKKKERLQNTQQLVIQNDETDNRQYSPAPSTVMAKKKDRLQSSQQLVMQSNETDNRQDSLFVRKFEEFQRQVLRELFIIKTRLKELTETVDILLRNGQDNGKNLLGRRSEEQIEEINFLFKKFPITIEEDLQQMEQVLTDDKKFNIVAKELSLVGGDNVKDTTNRILNHILAYSIGIRYSWEGFKGKKIFKNLKLATLILRAVRLNGNTKDATEADIIKVTKAWLVRCKVRETRQNNTIPLIDESEEHTTP